MVAKLPNNVLQILYNSFEHDDQLQGKITGPSEARTLASFVNKFAQNPPRS